MKSEFRQTSKSNIKTSPKNSSKITSKAEKKPPTSSNTIFKCLEEKVKTYTENVKNRVDILQSHFKEYSDIVDSKLQHLNMMQDYDIEFQIRQKYSSLWNDINSDKLSYLDSDDRLTLNNNLKQLRDQLIRIETDQNNQKQFLVFLSKTLHQVNRHCQKHEMKDASVQASLEGNDPIEIDKFEKAEVEYM